MAQKYRPSADLRRDLVAAAIRVIGNIGLGAATTRRIADEAGVPAPSLHYAFKDKEALLRAVYEQLTVTAFIEVGARVRPELGLERGLTELIDGYVRWHLVDRESGLTLIELTAWSLRTPTSEHLAARVYRRHIELTADLIREFATGTLTDDAVEELARLVVMAFDGIYLQWRSLDDASIARLQPAVTQMIVCHARELATARISAG